MHKQRKHHSSAREWMQMQEVELSKEVLRVLSKWSVVQPRKVLLLRLQEHKGGGLETHGRR